MDTMHQGILLLLLIIIIILSTYKSRREPFDLRTDCWNERVNCSIACQTRNKALNAQCLKDCYKNSVIC